MAQGQDSLLDQIYEAALVPSTWVGIIEKISSTINGAGGVLFTVNPNVAQEIFSPSLEYARTEFVKAGWDKKNSRISRVIERNLFGFTITDHDLFTDEELRVHPMYECLRSLGVGWCAGFTVQVPTDDTLVLSFERADAAGPFESAQVALLEALRPHISRSALLTARLGMERARAASEAMGLIGLPTAVVSVGRKLIGANELFSDYIPSIVIDGRDRLRLKDERADTLLVDALDRLQHASNAGVSLSIPLAATHEQPPIVLHVVPVRRAANDIFSGSSCLLVATPVGRKSAPSAALIQGLFDLTGAEARVARAIGAGGSPDEIAVNLGVSIGTIRNQLKAVFQKTGVSRQSDLVSLLGSISL